VKPILRDVFGASPDVHAYPCDITSPSSVADAFTALNKEISTESAFPSILVNAAGYISLSALEDTPAEETIKHLHVNLVGPMLASQEFARMYFRARDDKVRSKDVAPPGRIVNIASQAAHIALHHHGAYCASKAGLVGLTKCMSSEWGGRGITANTVSPGPVWTALGKKAWADDAVREEYLKGVPTGTFAEPEEVAAAVAWLCQDLSGNVNGADFRLDGGFTAR
jgi:NAD(P)-dependent dehydrogenase (short-subunit alcohol dehydrogenase family)